MKKMKSRFEGKFCPDVMGTCRLNDCVYYWTDGSCERCMKVASISSIMYVGKAVRETIVEILKYIQRR